MGQSQLVVVGLSLGDVGLCCLSSITPIHVLFLRGRRCYHPEAGLRRVA